MKNRLMTHVVAGYPSESECIKLLRGMEKLGIGSIEVQIPFSDPIADGETIMRANDKALEAGMTTKKSFDLLKRAGLSTDLYIMSYLQKIQAFGFDKFCDYANKVGAKGLIIPDLPFDAPEYKELLKDAKIFSLDIMPVVSPGMAKNRLAQVIRDANKLIYLTSMKGITGKRIKLNKELVETAKQAKKLKPEAKLAVGFGIASSKDVKEVLQFADLAIVGSSVIRQIEKSDINATLNFITRLCK